MSRSDHRNKQSGHSSSPTYLKLVQDNMPPLAPTASAAADVRRRVVIVPLDGPAPAPQATAVPRLAPIVQPSDRRQSWPGRDDAGDPATRLVCPSCAMTARVDVVDLRSKRLHLSCDRCYRMWQDQVRADDKVPAGLQRVR
jgi:hypothetical protein